jgi:acyl-CoA synthetase (NDP forming)
VLGVRCYPSLDALPETVEHVIFTVSDQRLEACLDEAIAHGIKACTIYSALTLEQDSTPLLKDRIAQKAKKAGVLLAGANCMGFYNFSKNVWCCGFDTRDHNAINQDKLGNVVLLSQSGAGMSGITDVDARIKFSFAASSGQELIICLEDYLDYVLDQPETRVVGLFLETSRQPEKFIAALEKARRKKIPILAVKVGKTAMAAELAVSHSGALTGSDVTYQAVFNRYGVQRVDDMDQLATALIMFSQPAQVTDGGLVSLHDSGGERQLLIDLADQYDVPLTQLNADSTARLEQQLDAGLPPVNPLDAWGAGGAGASQQMADCFSTLLADPQAALGAVVHDRAPDGKIYPSYIEYLRQAQKKINKPVFLVANRQGTGADPQVAEITQQGLPIIDGVSQFLVGVRCMLNYRDFINSGCIAGAVDIPSRQCERWQGRLQGLVKEGAERLTEIEASRLLSELAVPMTQPIGCASEAQLVSAAARLRYPVVLKTATEGIEHKSDVGGVVLGLNGEVALFEAYREMSKRLGPKVIVVPMVQDFGLEMLLGVAHDSQFGPVIVLGMGGIYAEVMNDVVALLPPFDAETAKRSLKKLKMRSLLDGVRGEPALDIDAYCEAAAKLSSFALAFKHQIKEIDINPVKVMATGCIGLDALIVLTAANSQEN